jgi:hypothetical protein
MKSRKLRIAWSVAWGIVAVLLIALWIRSYSHLQIIEKRFGSQTIQVSSVRGHFAIASLHPTAAIGMFYLSTAAVNAADWRELGPSGFACYRNSMGAILIVPHWFAALLCAIISAVVWLQWRFSLRTLLVATTLVAIGLGLVVWLR